MKNLLWVTLNGSDFSLQGLMGRDCRLLAGLVSVLFKKKRKMDIRLTLGL